MQPTDFLDGKNWRMFSIPIMHCVGTDAAILLGELASEYKYYKDRQLLHQDGAFYSTIENVEWYTGLSRHRQNNAIKILVEKGIIAVEVRESPPKRFFRIDNDAIVRLEDNKQANLENPDADTEGQSAQFVESSKPICRIQQINL